MSRDQRVNNNWAMLHAQDLALNSKVPLYVVFWLKNTRYSYARHYDFMLQGLQEVEQELNLLGVEFRLIRSVDVANFAHELNSIKPGAVVTDFAPLRGGRKWREIVAQNLQCELLEVDAHNIVPCRWVSNKQEYSARTFRAKIQKVLPEFLLPFPALASMPKELRAEKTNIDWKQVEKSLKLDYSVPAVGWLAPGGKAARKQLEKFALQGLNGYAENRNHADLDSLSHLSPYLHFGQIAPQEVALYVAKVMAVAQRDRDSFLEELIVRRELADNFCFYNPFYDSHACFPNWAKTTLQEQEKQDKKYTYTILELENAKTADLAWNAAQVQMMLTGKMHGYMRMYWAKRILEWAPNYKEAMYWAVHLNDKYSLDGRDPNGYTGCAWAVGGIHDRPWPKRPIYGMVRSMAPTGLAKKFDVEAYVNQVFRLTK